MKLFLRGLHATVAVILGVTGLLIGASVGYANGGWIGAVAIGTIGLLAGLFLASGPNGWGLLLQLLP